MCWRHRPPNSHCCNAEKFDGLLDCSFFHKCSCWRYRCNWPSLNYAFNVTPIYGQLLSLCNKNCKDRGWAETQAIRRPMSFKNDNASSPRAPSPANCWYLAVLYFCICDGIYEFKHQYIKVVGENQENIIQATYPEVCRLCMRLYPLRLILTIFD